jgi:hypothetical protein
MVQSCCFFFSASTRKPSDKKISFSKSKEIETEEIQTDVSTSAESSTLCSFRDFKDFLKDDKKSKTPDRKEEPATVRLDKIEKIKQKIDFYEQLIGRIKVGINNATSEALKIDGARTIEKKDDVKQVAKTVEKQANLEVPQVKVQAYNADMSRTSEIRDEIPSNVYSSFVDEKKSEKQDYSDTFVANEESIKTVDFSNKTDDSSTSFDGNSENPIKKLSVDEPSTVPQHDPVKIEKEDNTDVSESTESIETSINVDSNRTKTIEKSVAKSDDRSESVDEKSMTQRDSAVDQTDRNIEQESTPRQLVDEITESPRQGDKLETAEQVPIAATPHVNADFIIDIILTDTFELFERIRLKKIENNHRRQELRVDDLKPQDLSKTSLLRFDEEPPVIPIEMPAAVVVPSIDLKSLDAGAKSQKTAEKDKKLQSMFHLAESHGLVNQIIRSQLRRFSTGASYQVDPPSKDIKTAFKQLLLDLVVEIMRGFYSKNNAHQNSINTYFEKLSNDPARLSATESSIKKQLFGLFQKKSGLAETLGSSKWRLQRRFDMIDQMLDKEMRENEYEWSNFEKEENEAKLIMADLVSDGIISDAISNILRFYKVKSLKSSSMR